MADRELRTLLAQKQFADLDVETFREAPTHARRVAAAKFVRGNIAFQGMARKTGPLLTEKVLDQKREELRRELQDNK